MAYTQLGREAPPIYREEPHSAATTHTDPHHTIASDNGDTVNFCCIILSIFNFVCFPWCGIPAIIFTILGIEAERKGEQREAHNYVKYLAIFNIVGCILFLLNIIIGIAVTISVEVSNNAKQ